MTEQADQENARGARSQKKGGGEKGTRGGSIKKDLGGVFLKKKKHKKNDATPGGPEIPERNRTYR